MDDNVLQRINLFFKANNITNRRVADIIGMSETTLNSKLNGTRGLDLDTLQKILMQFEELSPDWLLKGKGDMVTQNINQTNEHGDNINAGRDISLDKSVKSNIDPKYVDKLEKDNERMIQEIYKLKDDLLKSQQTIIDLLQKK